MMRALFLALVILIGIAVCAAGYLLGRHVPFAQQWPLFEALRNTASIIFAVVGAWLAIIYPERLKLSFGKAPSHQEAGGRSVRLLFVPAVHSTIMLALLLIIGIAAPLLKQIPALMDHVTMLRGLSYASVALLTWWQVVIVVMTLFPVETLQDFVDRESALNAIRASRGTDR